MVVAIVSLAAMVGYLALQRDTLDALRSISPWTAVLLIGLGVLALAVQAEQYRSAVGIQDVDMASGESIALTAANAMANYYLPVRGGMVVRAAYMKRVYRFPLARYGALTVSITGLTMIVAAAVGALGVALASARGDPIDPAVTLTFIGIAVAVVGGVAGALVVASRVKARNRFGTVVQSFREGMRMWGSARHDLVVFLLWSIGLLASQGIRLWISFLAVGVTPDLPEMMIIQGFAAIAFVMALTPGNVGIKEGAVVFSASLLGVDPTLALLASLIDRAAAVVITFAVGLATVPYLSRRTAEAGKVDSATDSPPDEASDVS
jgi:uncharacterized membrane protein YbhN (UPF0104 family)